MTDLTKRSGPLLQWSENSRAVDRGGQVRLRWTRLSCHRFVANQVRLWVLVLAYNLGNFLRRLALPSVIKDWLLRSLQVKLIKIGARMVRDAWRIIFQMAEVAVPREVFAAIPERIGRLGCAYT